MKTLINRCNFMKNRWTLCVFVFTYLVGCAQPTQRTISDGENTDKCQSPYFVVLGDDTGNEKLPLKSTQVDVNISGVIADVKVRQCYSNTGNKPIEAIYVFPASTRAAVYNMVMKINDREIIAQVEEKNQARTMYETAKNEGKTASLLEEQRPNVFQMNVANIMPGAKVEVTLSYTELLVPTESVYEFVYPTVVGPRYVSGGEIETGTSENWAANPYLEEGVKPTSTLTINLNLKAGMPIKEIRCETHKNDINYSDKSTASVKMTETEGGNRDFVVQYRLAGDKIESGLLLYEDAKGEKYFLAMMQPPKRVEPEMITPREYVFIVDVSGSMSGFPLDVSKQLMKNILNGLKDSDRFNIVLFAGGSNVYSPQSLPATTKNKADALIYLQSLSGSGGTELLEALNTAMGLNSDENFSRSFVILTDGYVTVEKEAFDFIRNNLGNANFFAFGIGSSVNRFIIEGMASVGCGEPFIALDEQEATKQAKKFINYVSSPVLTSIDIKFNGLNTYDVLPDKMPDLFANRPLIIVGKYKGEAIGAIEISGKTGKEKFNSSWEIEQNQHPEQTKAIKYLWAREKIRLVSDYNNLQQKDELRNEIIKLGKQYNLLTEYTSFIAIDSEISNLGGNQTSVKQPLPLPEGVSNNAVGNPSVNKRYSSPVSANTGTQELRYSKSVELEAINSSSVENLSVVEDKEEMEVLTSASEMPKFQGGDIKTFEKYIQQNIVYPPTAKAKKISGKVYIRFIVDETGKVTDIKIIRGVDPLLDAEAIRVIKSSPLWIAGKQDGKPVKIIYTIPIEFSLLK